MGGVCVRLGRAKPPKNGVKLNPQIFWIALEGLVVISFLT